MNEYKIENVWQKQDSQTTEEIISFWLAEKAMAENDALERVPQVVMIGRDNDGKIAGVCTAYINYFPALVNNFYYYRSYIALEH